MMRLVLHWLFGHGMERLPPIEVGRKRLVIGAAVFLFLFAALAVQLFNVVLQQQGAPMRTARGSATAEKPTGRGEIFDASGQLVATSLATQSLGANPQLIEDPKAVARQLTRVLPFLNEAEIATRLAADRKFLWLHRGLTPRQQAAVNALGVPGFEFRREEKRFYPYGALAAHVTGLVGIDGEGLSGMEKYFDDVLKVSGSRIDMSIDMRVQYVLREELKEAVAKFRAIGAAGMVMDVSTGEIVAMVSLPDFDPNNINEATEEARFNRNTLGVYEMGSTFKLLNTAMALDSGVANLNSAMDAREPIHISRFTIDDFKPKQRRWLTIPEIIIYSSNIGSARLAVEAGMDRQRAFMQRAGMLQRPTLELPEIGTPLYPAHWREINTMTIAFGHGMSVTPLQMVSAVSAIVNGGILRPATLVKRPADAPVPGTRIISKQTSDKMRWLMRLVVSQGTGKKAEVEMYPPGGKTGTAEKTGHGGYRHKALLSSFIGAFPIQAPRYVVLAMVDEPQPLKETYGYATGGWVSAPIAHQVIQRIAPILGLPPLPAPEDDPADRPIEASLKVRR